MKLIMEVMVVIEVIDMCVVSVNVGVAEGSVMCGLSDP